MITRSRIATARYCSGCGTRLPADAPVVDCRPCRRRAAQLLAGAPPVPAEFWRVDRMRDALASWHMGRVIAAYRTHPIHRRQLSQELVGSWVGRTQAQISRIETAHPSKTSTDSHYGHAPCASPHHCCGSSFPRIAPTQTLTVTSRPRADGERSTVRAARTHHAPVVGRCCLRAAATARGTAPQVFRDVPRSARQESAHSTPDRPRRRSIQPGPRQPTPFGDEQRAPSATPGRRRWIDSVCDRCEQRAVVGPARGGSASAGHAARVEQNPLVPVIRPRGGGGQGSRGWCSRGRVWRGLTPALPWRCRGSHGPRLSSCPGRAAELVRRTGPTGP